MDNQNLYLAVCLGNQESPRMKAWLALPEHQRQVEMQKGMDAWHQWVTHNKASIVELGGPLGLTKRVDESGIHDINNNLSGFHIVRADSFEEAAELFKDHPHFSIFPGEAVEIMPILPVPGK